MRVEATRFKVKNDKIDMAKEMLKMLNDRKGECIQTLYREKMYVEAIFSDMVNGEMYLTWFSVQGEGGADVMTSELQIDKDYLEYWKDCVDRTYKPVDEALELSLIYPEIYEWMKEADKKY